MSLLDQVEAWIADDVDPADADELRILADQATASGHDEQTAAAAEAELQDRFAGVLQFGTAGLRGRLGAGPNRMNRAVVIRAAAGLISYLNERLDNGATVVIGYDARHRSDAFAADTAHVVAAAGGRALLLPGPLPTPVLAFAVRHVGADAGVMVTASHNPPQDNGYKVYLGGRVTPDEGAGVQIVPPADADIAAHIAAVLSVSAVPRSASAIEASGGQFTELGDEIRSAYTERALASVPQGPRDLRIVLTPLHGVGGHLASEVLTRAGFDDVTLVAEQGEPDPEFSTVAFPNPEEPGAMDLAVATAVRVGADLIIANDPDADRCSIAVPDAAVEGRWRQLTGDEAGALLGEQAAIEAASGRGRTTGAGSGQEPDPPSGQEPHPPAGQVPGPGPVLASSVVSSRVLAAIADAHGLTHRNTLTGFKWIARVPGLVFGYEEAIGYCVDPQGVRDKDGITAALHLAALAARLRHDGGSIPGALDDLARRYGLHATAPLSVRVDDLSLIGAAMARLREHPPATLAGSAVAQALDLAQGSAGLPATDALLYLTVDADRVIVRPSGTEPKVKCYLEVILPVGDGEDVCEVRARATARLAELSADIGAAAGLT